MKKLSIIAGFVFTTVFFTSCESDQVIPQNTYPTNTSQIIDFVEPEFAAQKRPNGKTLENMIFPTATEVLSVEEIKQEQ
jgi:PBP1b-binding outer membrane lipoprotein LpoB